MQQRKNFDRAYKLHAADIDIVIFDQIMEWR